MSYRRRRFHLIFLAMISLCAARSFAAAPTISGFSPASGILSSTVTITGSNFVSPATVSFNGVACTLISVSSSTTIHANVPATGSTGTITVSTSGGSATSSSAFTVLPGVAVAPSAVGPPTTAATLYYSGFGALEGVDFYFDTGDIALGAASASGAGNIAVTIPAAAHPGSHWITAVGRHSGYAGQTPFTVRASWPQFGFAPNHKAKNRYENVLSTATVGDLDEGWRTSSYFDVETTPAIVNGIVYACFGDGSIRAFDETTGALKWTYVIGNFVGMYSSPAVANGIVYAGSTDNYLYALDAVTGALKWRYATGSYVESSPTVVNGIVYFGSSDKNVYALNATTGALVWSFPTGNIVLSSPMVANGVLYVGSYDKNVYALNAATGAKIWQYLLGGEISASPVLVGGGLICVGCLDGNMYALYTDNGALGWTYNTGAGIESSAAAAGGAIFFGGDNGYVYSLSSKGSVRWSSTALGPITSAVCVANGVVYVTNYAFTYALDENTGALLTTLPVGSEDGGAAVANGAVFSGDIRIGVLARYTLNGLLSNFVAPRPDPMQLRPHPLR